MIFSTSILITPGNLSIAMHSFIAKVGNIKPIILGNMCEYGKKHQKLKYIYVHIIGV
jgi:hypothetical protein